MSRKTSFIQIIVLLSIASGFLFNPIKAQARHADRETQRSMMLASAVEFRWDKDVNSRQAHESLGTKVSKHSVLTHNHFQNLSGTHIVDPSNTKRPHGVSNTTRTSAFGRSTRYGAQTRLVHSAVKYAGAVAPIATQRTIKGLRVGDMVNVVYWDDPREQMAVAVFEIRAIKDNTVIVLNDPANIINGGDSGGGVFYNGQLIGNTWRYVQITDRAGNQLDKEVHVQIVPPELNRALRNW